MSKEIKELVKISKALADENRFKIFSLISEKGEIACKEITSYFNLTQPTISHHLKVLMDSGLVDVRREGQWGYFSVNKSAISKFSNLLSKHTA